MLCGAKLERFITQYKSVCQHFISSIVIVDVYYISRGIAGTVIRISFVTPHAKQSEAKDRRIPSNCKFLHKKAVQTAYMDQRL